jgi:enoyl-CoA hydratase/carnithine racemase
VSALAGAILKKSPVAVATGKRMFYRQIELGMKEAYDYAAEVMACNMMAEDAARGHRRLHAETPSGVERPLN